ncbi:hypothetical protein DY138_04270 [Apilactobacillus timberlakei]|nr:hypothetical protein DY138_04270 [Apilactobacillus timberlakei]
MDNVPYDNSKSVINKPLDILLKSICSLIGIMLISVGATFLLEGHIGMDHMMQLLPLYLIKFMLNIKLLEVPKI